MSITSHNPVKPSLAVEVFRALNELQALGPSLQQAASLRATNTAIIWRDGKLCFEGFDAIEQVHFAGGIMIGSVGVTPNQTFIWPLNTEADTSDPSQSLRDVWTDLLTGERSELAGTMLGVGRIPADYDLGELSIDAGSFVLSAVNVDEDKMSESYIRIFESQVEELCVPLAVPGLNSAEAGAIADQIWFDNDVVAVDLRTAIDKLDRLTMISEALQLARYNLERAF